VKSAILALAALSAAALVPAAGGAPRTTEPGQIVNVHVTITDTRMIVTPKSSPRGVYGRFIVVNTGVKPHNFTLGSAVRGRGAATGFSQTVNPRGQHVALLFLDLRGQLPYYSKLKDDRTKPGMRGVFRIQ
jgi:hypothetical protein